MSRESASAPTSRTHLQCHAQQEKEEIWWLVVGGPKSALVGPPLVGLRYMMQASELREFGHVPLV